MDDVNSDNACKRNNRKNTIIKLITNINISICVALFINMIVFASVYIVRSQRFMLKSEENIPVDTLLILKQGTSLIYDDYNISYIIPDFIGLNFDKGLIGLINNAEVMKDVYLTTSEYVKYVLGDNYVCTKKDTLGGEAIWKSCLADNNYIYIKYAMSLPSVVIGSFLNMDINTSEPDESIVMIREMFLMFNYYGSDRYSIHAVTRDDNGNVAVFDYDYSNSEPREYFTVKSILPYYGNNLFARYSFSAENQSVTEYKLPLKDTTLIYSRDILTHDITIANVNDSRFSGESADRILKLFGYNPDKLNSFINTDGTLVYIETHGELEIHSDKMIYNANKNNGGINISDYLSYGLYNGNYDISEKIKATSIIIDTIRKTDSGFIGGDAGIKLYGLVYNNKTNNLIIKYSYYYDNIIINTEESSFDACSFILNENKIISVYINSIRVKGSPDKRMNYPQLWMLDKIGSSIESVTAGGMQLIYLIKSGVENTFRTQWMYTTDSDSVIYKNDSDIGLISDSDYNGKEVSTGDEMD